MFLANFRFCGFFFSFCTYVISWSHHKQECIPDDAYRPLQWPSQGGGCLPGRGVCPGRGGGAQGYVCVPRGVSVQWGCAQEGVCLGGCLPGGCLSPPTLHRQIPVKILPCPKLRLREVISKHYMYNQLTRFQSLNLTSFNSFFFCLTVRK